MNYVSQFTASCFTPFGDHLQHRSSRLSQFLKDARLGSTHHLHRSHWFSSRRQKPFVTPALKRRTNSTRFYVSRQFHKNQTMIGLGNKCCGPLHGSFEGTPCLLRRILYRRYWNAKTSHSRARSSTSILAKSLAIRIECHRGSLHIRRPEVLLPSLLAGLR